MDTALFDYHLPSEQVAQEPAAKREAARLLVLPAGGGSPRDAEIGALASHLRSGDLLVLNDTRVVPARLRARRASGGQVEIFLLEPWRAERGPCRCLLRASRRPRPGEAMDLAGGGQVVMLEERGGGEALVDLRPTAAGGGEVSLMGWLETHGEIPLPPYIRREPGDRRAALDRERYQTIYARQPGAVAAPTAGLHFTAALLQRLKAVGIEHAALTLHVGPGTFRPVTTAAAEAHLLDAERYILEPAAAAAVAATRARGGRVIACGTTVVRVLEARATAGGGVEPGEGLCGLFILPGHRFRVVDGLLTNFHLPRSSLLMLVCALAGRERVLAAYAAAVERGYRFYSYGDAMLIQPGDRVAA